MPAMQFYAGRIPRYTRKGMLLRVCYLILGVASSVLARYELNSWVAIVAAAATAITSWGEFSDTQAKVERYSNATMHLKKLLSWWRSLSEVQKASRDSIETLVRSSEEIISNERTSWMSISSTKQVAEDKEGDEDVERGRQARVAPEP